MNKFSKDLNSVINVLIGSIHFFLSCLAATSTLLLIIYVTSKVLIERIL